MNNLYLDIDSRERARAIHHCHARGCSKEIPTRLLMCLTHWRMVPKNLQRQVWLHYRPGQETDKRPTPQYLVTMHEAIEAVAQKEEHNHA